MRSSRRLAARLEPPPRPSVDGFRLKAEVARGRESRGRERGVRRAVVQNAALDDLAFAAQAPFRSRFWIIVPTGGRRGSRWRGGVGSFSARALFGLVVGGGRDGRLGGGRRVGGRLERGEPQRPAWRSPVASAPASLLAFSSGASAATVSTGSCGIASARTFAAAARPAASARSFFPPTFASCAHTFAAALHSLAFS